MRFTVTGGAGFIGSHIVEHLVGEGHEVVVLDDFSTGRRENLQRFAGRFRLLEGSVTDPDVCMEAIAGADFVLHLAALPSVPRSVADPVRCHEVNATGTLNVLLAARDAGVQRVVYAGSSSAYGDTPHLPKVETLPSRPRSPYAAAKLMGESYCRAFHASYGVPAIALRYFNIFGPRQDPKSQYSAVIPKFILAALTGQRPIIHGDGEQTRDFTYVANVVRANLLACAAPPEALGEVINVGCGSRISLNQLWRGIAEGTSARVEPSYTAARSGDVRDSLADLTRARELLGYEPIVSLHEGVARTIAHFTAQTAEMPAVA